MLSKEEIKNSFIRIETICKKEVCLFNQPIIEGNLNQIKRYIIQLESDKQKLIEKLEKDIREETGYARWTNSYTKEISQAVTKIISKSKYAQEILSILKGENQVTVK